MPFTNLIAASLAEFGGSFSVLAAVRIHRVEIARRWDDGDDALTVLPVRRKEANVGSVGKVRHADGAW